MNEQNASLSPTGKVYNVQTTDSLGNFSVASGVGTNLVEIVGNGFYVDDLTGLLSSAAIQLHGIADLNVNTSPTVNVLTSLQEPRLKTLISQGLTYAAAYAQSQSEVLSIFGIDAKKVNSLSMLYSMKFDGNTDADSVLVATSVVLSQMATDAASTNGTTQPAELSNYINTLAAQLASTGAVTSSTFATARNLAETEIKLSAVRSNLETYYAKNGLTIVAPKFEEWIDQSSSGILPQRLVAVTGLAFTDTTAASPGQLVTSDVVTIAGVGAGVVAPVAVMAGTTIIKNNAAVSGLYTEVQDGDTIAMRVTAPGYDITNPPSTISVGSSSAVWRVTSAPLGGPISGLTASGLVLQVNGADNISIAAGSTSFSFPVAMANGTAYNVSVLTQPHSNSQLQVCSVSNGSGIVGAAPSGISLVCNNPSELVLVAYPSFITKFVNPGSISAFPIDPTTGAPIQSGIPFATSNFTSGNSPSSIAVDPSGKFAYVPCPQDQTVWVYSIYPTWQLLSQVAVFSFGAAVPGIITFAPNGKFAYGTVVGGIAAYAIAAPVGLTEITGSPFANGARSVTSITVDPTSKFVYAANGGNPGSVSGYTIDSTTGAPTPIAGSPFPTDVASDFVAVDPSGRFAYVANSGLSNASVSAFTIDATSGALTPIAGSPFSAGSGGGVVSIAIDSNGKFAYVGNSASGSISAYTIDLTTGALTPITGSPFAGASGIAVIDPSGKFLYTLSAVFSIDSTTGVLTAITSNPFPTAGFGGLQFGPTSIATTNIP